MRDHPLRNACVYLSFSRCVRVCVRVFLRNWNIMIVFSSFCIVTRNTHLCYWPAGPFRRCILYTHYTYERKTNLFLSSGFKHGRYIGKQFFFFFSFWDITCRTLFAHPHPFWITQSASSPFGNCQNGCVRNTHMLVLGSMTEPFLSQTNQVYPEFFWTWFDVRTEKKCLKINFMPKTKFFHYHFLSSLSRMTAMTTIANMRMFALKWNEANVTHFFLFFQMVFIYLRRGEQMRNGDVDEVYEVELLSDSKITQQIHTQLMQQKLVHHIIICVVIFSLHILSVT